MSVIEQARTHLSPSAVCERLLPDGVIERGEWVALNPTRNDRNPGSFRINLESGAWKDFATNDRGTDTISLWAYVRGLRTQVAAAREMLELDPAGGPPVKRYVKRELTVQWPLPDDAPSPPAKRDIVHPELGKSDHLYEYLTKEGKLIGYVARWDEEDKKEIRPYFFAVGEDGQGRWRWCGPTGLDARPLYGLNRLGPQSKSVIIVEGEKTADAAQKIMGSDIACLTWLGGASNVEKADFVPIQGRKVTLFPDFDSEADKPLEHQTGMKAMIVLAEKLLALQCKVYIVKYVVGERVHGWDLADALDEGWDKERVKSYILENMERVGAKKVEENFDETFGMFRPYSLIPSDMFDYVKTAGGKPVEVWQNVARMLHLYGIRACHNEMTRLNEFVSPHDVIIAEAPDMCTLNGIAAGKVFDKIDIIARKNSYHPAKDWVLSKRWDGMKRIELLADTVGHGNDLTRILIRRWAVSAVAVLMQDRPDITARGCLVFVGPQYSGKTTWIKNLALDSMVHIGAELSVKDKDSKDQLTTAWITELGELGETFKKSTQDSLKNFIGLASDKMRLSYRRDAETFARRTVFVANANDKQVLVDPTGNSRWWTVEADTIDRHSIDMQQAWAEALELYRSGEPWHLLPQELADLERRNASHMTADAVADAIVSGIDWHLIAAPDAPGAWLAPGEILRRLRMSVNSAAARQAARALETLTTEKRVGNTRLFFVPRTLV